MSEPLTSDSTGNTRNQALAIGIAFVFFTVLCSWLTWPLPPVGFFWDDAWYVLMSEWYSGRYEHDQLVWNMLQSRQYPPLFPYILSFTGTVLTDTQGAAIINVVFLAAGAALTMLLLIDQRVPVVAATISASLLILLPVALDLIAFLLSEHLYIFLTTLVLLLCTSKSRKLYLWMLIGALTGLCVATRSTGWMLALAIPVSLVLKSEWHRLAYFTPGLLAGLLVIVYLRVGLPASPGYIAIFRHEIDSIGVGYLLGQVKAFLDGWVGLWESIMAALLAGVLLIPGLYIRLRKNCIDAWYLLLSFALIAIWPFPEQYPRLLWVLLPALLLAMFSTIELLNNESRRYMVSTAVGIFLIAVNIENGIARTTARIVNPPGAEYSDFTRMREWTRVPDKEDATSMIKVVGQMMRDISQIKNTVASGSCVYSDLPAVVATHSLVPSYSPGRAKHQPITANSNRCSYYYAIPSRWADNTIKDLENSTSRYEEIFRSSVPAHGIENFVVGVFYQLKTSQD